MNQAKTITGRDEARTWAQAARRRLLHAKSIPGIGGPADLGLDLRRPSGGPGGRARPAFFQAPGANHLALLGRDPAGASLGVAAER